MRVIFGTSASLIVVVLTAYPLSKTDGRFKGRTGFTWFFLVTMFLSGGLFATYFLYKQLGLLNSFLIYVLPGACDVWFVLMLMNFQRHSARYRRGGFIRQSGAIYHFVQNIYSAFYAFNRYNCFIYGGGAMEQLV